MSANGDGIRCTVIQCTTRSPIEKVAPSIEQFVVLETLFIIPINPILSPPPPLLFVNDPPLILTLYEFRSSRMEVTLNVPLVISKRCGLEEEGVPSASKVSLASLSKHHHYRYG